MLFKNILSFSHNVFKRLFPQRWQKVSLFGKWVDPLPDDKVLPLSKLKAFPVQSTISMWLKWCNFFFSAENIVEKAAKKNAGYWHFFHFPQCF